MKSLDGKSVILGVSGSIAAYKIAYLASSLKKKGCDVHVIMTKNACQFITPVTFETLTGNKCMVDTFDRDFEFDVAHVSLAKKADLIMIAPATANMIAKLANGIADDMLTTTVLAAKCPKFVSPAMNTAMYENPVTMDNIDKLAKYGYEIIEPAVGMLACNDEGKGKMPEPQLLEKYILERIGTKQDLAGKKVLVTAGPTLESIDPVRFVSNHSSGKMGYALAEVCALRGADVTLVSGPTSITASKNIRIVDVKNAEQMFDSVMRNFDDSDIVFMAAAVADYTPVSTSAQKIKKQSGNISLEMKRTKDILKEMGSRKKGQFICGFSMETENLIENSRAKLKNKNADMIIANSLTTAGAGFGSDTNVVTIITDDNAESLPMMSKSDVAGSIIDHVIKML